MKFEEIKPYLIALVFAGMTYYLGLLQGKSQDILRVNRNLNARNDRCTELWNFAVKRDRTILDAAREEGLLK